MGNVLTNTFPSDIIKSSKERKKMKKTVLQLKVDFFKMMMQYVIDTNNKQLLADWLDFLEISNENISDESVETIYSFDRLVEVINEGFSKDYDEDDNSYNDAISIIDECYSEIL